MPRTVTGAAPALLALASTGTLAHAATFADLASEVRESLSYGKTSFMARYRWEHVNQVPFRDEANASTVRAALMYETKPWHGFSGALQYEAIGVVGEELYDRVPGFQGVNRYPVVQDPEGADLNQAWVRWASPAGPTQVAVKGGRQEIVLNNQRIIGPVGWRQNQQSFDAVTGQLVAWRDWSLSGGYFSKVHRITGDATRNTGGTAGAPVVSVNDGVLDMDSWYANAGWKLADRLSVAAYAVALNYESPQAKGNNSRTYGARLEGPWKLGDDWAVIGCAEAALQEDYADYAVGAVTDYQAWYYQAELGAAWKGIGIKGGWSLMQGDGPGDKFNTPLATLHAFNGWAEKFLTTPDQGLDARYVWIGGPLKPLWEPLDGMTFAIVGWQFHSQSLSRHYGDEIDAMVEYTVLPVDKNWLLGAKIGAFNEDTADTVTTGAGGVARDTVKTSVYTVYRF